MKERLREHGNEVEREEKKSEEEEMKRGKEGRRLGDEILPLIILFALPCV